MIAPTNETLPAANKSDAHEYPAGNSSVDDDLAGGDEVQLELF